MSFSTPIIPQSVEQAQQRDELAGMSPVAVEGPHAELQRLRQAIREHRATVRDTGDPMHEADLALWSHVEDA